MIKELSLAEILHVAKRMDDAQWNEIACVSFFNSREEYAAAQFLKTGVKFSLVQDGEVWSCGGITFDNEWRGSMWMIHQPGWEKYVKEAIQIGRDMIEHCGLRLIHALVMKGNDKALNYIQHMGFIECGSLNAYGRDGESFYMHEIVRK